MKKILQLCSEQGVELSLQDDTLEVFFDEAPTDELIDLLKENKPELIRYLQRHKSGTSPLSAIPVIGKSTAPLTFGQKRMWFIDQLENGSAQYNLPIILELNGELIVSALQQALDNLLARHQILRTQYEVSGTRQLVTENSHLPLECLQQENHNIAELVTNSVSQAFDLDREIPIRARLIEQSPQRHVLVLTIHHIACDGWSLGIIVKELTENYKSLVLQQAPASEPLPIQYGDYAYWQESQIDRLQEGLKYWTTQLQQAPVLHQLPTTHPRPVYQSFRGAKVLTQISAAKHDAVAQLCRKLDVTNFMFYYSLFSALLAKWSNETDILVGTPIANRSHTDLEPLVGYIANTIVLRSQVNQENSFSRLLSDNKDMLLEAYENQDVPFEMLVENLQPERSLSYSPIFQVLFSFHNQAVENIPLPGLNVKEIQDIQPQAKFDLELAISNTESAPELSWIYAADVFEQNTITRMSESFERLLDAVLENANSCIKDINMMPISDLTLLEKMSKSPAVGISELPIHKISNLAVQIPEQIALEFQGQQLSYLMLEEQSNQVAHYLLSKGVQHNDIVGVNISRSLNMVVAMLGVLKAGAAYLPLEPGYPQNRLDQMIEDSGCKLVLTDSLIEELPVATFSNVAEGLPEISATQLAYVIYTSGSTGKPKGVMVNHGNMSAFINAMAPQLQDKDIVWLAVTGISFDISVLEIFGALSHQAKVVILPEQSLLPGQPDTTSSNESEQPLMATHVAQDVDFSLFYFADGGNDDNQDLYRLLMEGARYADENGFKAVWTPERHFASFGGIYPDPAVTSAALAATTKNIQVRAGSCVLPLNNPIKVAEQWAAIDNISNGRTGLAFASGWHANDFVLAPENFEKRFQALDEGIDIFRKLWSGESYTTKNGRGEDTDVKVFPRPVQREVPLWLTAAGNPKTFERAGELGLGVLTHILRQSHGELQQNIDRYQAAWKRAGHPGSGKVTVMIHTYIAQSQEAALATVKEPFKRYLSSAIDLSANGTENPDQLSHEEILEAAFVRYANKGALFGDHQHCAKVIRSLTEIGVTEIACLIDFGVATAEVLESLPRIKHLMNEIQGNNSQDAEESTVGQIIAQQGITHIQCTPSFARAHLTTVSEPAAVQSLKKIFIGGEAFPADLMQPLQHLSDATLHNMYGPTEATVWASTYEVQGSEKTIPVGKPLPGYQCLVLDKHHNTVPVGVTGELFIAGPGVTDGYLNREQLTAERFLPVPGHPQQRMYATGDNARWTNAGLLECLGRNDNQIKLRGHRIELGEIEHHLSHHQNVAVCAVILDKSDSGDYRLVAYIEPVYSLSNEEEGLLRQELRQYLSKQLPHYMMPNLFMFLTKMPLTLNGKIARKALPKPQITIAVPDFLAPQTDTEKAIVAVWAQLLATSPETISCNSNFFELGGHSLLLTRLQTELQSHFDVELNIRELFENPFVTKLAWVIEQKSTLTEDNRRFDEVTQASDEQTESLTL